MGEPGKTHRLLVVDDENDIVEVLTYLFRRAGYEVVSASRGKAALEIVKAGGVDLMLLDYMLPDINGLEVLRQAREFSPDLKVIIVTGRAADRTLAELMDSGAVSYITKPFLNDHLMKLVHEALDN